MRLPKGKAVLLHEQFAVTTHITQIAVSNTVPTTRFLLLTIPDLHWSSASCPNKMIKVLTLMHALLDL
jgi:hypothetical protein